MKNKYEIRGKTTCVFVDRADGIVLEVLIDTEDLELVSLFHNSWGAVKIKGDSFQIKGTYREDKVKKNISLSRYILGKDLKDPIRFLNKNSLDHRKVNLVIGYETQIPKGNEYEIEDGIVYMKLNRIGKPPLVTKIDADDVERVLAKGTWYAEWHKDINNYLVNNVSFSNEDGKKIRKKLSLHLFIKGVEDSLPVKHIDGDTLNNCKSNLKVYSNEMINDYFDGDENTVAIIIRDKYGIETARTLIDKDDFERVKNNGYTWFYFKAKGEPYAVANSKEGRIYLHRFIMNTPKEMVTDHKNHDTLDNRKSNLTNATISQNQQNRKGARKGSKSRIRGVSWDEKNQDWLVVVKGIYFGRFKDKEEAKKLADEKIEELMPYNSKL